VLQLRAKAKTSKPVRHATSKNKLSADSNRIAGESQWLASKAVGFVQIGDREVPSVVRSLERVKRTLQTLNFYPQPAVRIRTPLLQRERNQPSEGKDQTVHLREVGLPR
jgi:hypothetical protein